jgi:hypothetical protein
VYGDPGDLIYKPRNVWHTFWNATDQPARLLEIISPAGFEQMFVEGAELVKTTAPDDIDAAIALYTRYGLQFDLEATAPIIAEHGLIGEPQP